MPTQMTIGQLARRAGVAPSALRFYEDRALVMPVGRSDGGYRLYDEESAARVRFIQRAQTLGLTLDEISDLLHATDSHDPIPARERLRHMVAHKMTATREQLDEMQRFIAQLEQVYLRLGQDPEECVCSHLGSCDCLPFEVGDSERQHLQRELVVIQSGGCSCGCGDQDLGSA